MAETLDPLATAQRIEDDYRSYLTTSFAPIKQTLRDDFVAALAEPGRIRKGPILQATPPYRPGKTMADLVADGVLHRDFLGTGSAALPTERPLYLHQQEALEKLNNQRNLIVATGTGSGKTECYLLPVLDHLLREREAGTLAQPGVRALLLYPMNALANDQMKRIRDLFAPYPEIRFGRYVGDTEADPDKALAKYKNQLRTTPPPGELIDRASIQARPPHVLLTNFAMLEYLLLRPNDSTIFDGPSGDHWRFMVLDEVHVYDGAKGAEVAMLLRRVRDRVHQSEHGKLQCIGTSATLGRGVEDSAKVAEFAQALFDESFTDQDVVHPARLPLRHGASEWTIDEAKLAQLHAAWAEEAVPDQLLAIAGRAVDGAAATSVGTALWTILHNEHHVVELQRRIEEHSQDLALLADVAQGFVDPTRAIVRLVDLCIAARRDEASAPLIPARYHLWLRASEGSFACLHPHHPHGSVRVKLDRFEHCPDCSRQRTESKMMELAICRHCRKEFLVGQVEDDVFRLASGFERHLVHLIPEEVEDLASEVDEDEESIEGEADPNTEKSRLCLGCGTLSTSATKCLCSSPTWLTVTQLPKTPGGVVKRCPHCKRHSNIGVALRFMSGSEAPVAVIATSLYQSLPAAPNPPRRASAGGRKLLMFSDSRQDAAFFAPYLQRTYSRALERRMLWQRLAGDTEVSKFGDLVQPICRQAERLGVLDEDDGKGNAAAVMSWLFAEIVATDRRQSIDGVGLAEVGPALPARFDVPAALAPFQLDEREAFDVTKVLLDSLRQSAAVTPPDEVNVKEDIRFAPRNTTGWVRGSGSSPGVLAWTPARGANRRADYLAKLARARGIQADIPIVLRDLWDELTDAGSPMAKVLQAHDVAGLGTVYALNHERIEFRSPAAGAVPRRCSVCRQVWWRNVAGVCPTYKCEGQLHDISEPETNHYSSLYQRLSPWPITVEEHTGQLRPSRAAELQEKFTRGELNALSCSTTFELGVDVGEVQAVLLRNVPPSPANYVQRAGRAGRRLGSAALVVAFAQRRSHDRSYFDEPAAMVDGLVSAPFITIDNESIVRRHVHAIAFAQFERERVDQGGFPVRTMADLLDGPNGQSVADRFIVWLQARPQSLLAVLRRVVPAETANVIGVVSWTWVDRLLAADQSGFGGWLTDLLSSARADLAELEALEDEASANKNHGRAASLARTRRTFEQRRVIDQFAQRGVLPKYGFPVDVVDLDVSRSQNGTVLDLNRDLRLGILEFAPGAKVVAANRLWTSIGIKMLGGRQLPEWFWGICGGCGTLRSQLADPGMTNNESFVTPCEQCGSDEFAQGRRGRFVIPMFGFVGDGDRERPGETRPPREGYLETYFAEFDGPAPAVEVVELGGVPLLSRSSRRGWVTVFNRGRSRVGFMYCSTCGYATDEPPRRTAKNAQPPKHTRPHSAKECVGRARPIDLGHRFITNVLELQLPEAQGAWKAGVASTSTLHALIAGAPAVGVTQNDIGGSLAVGANGQPVIVLFDDVPGGAGHTRHLRENLSQLVDSAIERVAGCSCGLDTSCYGCLRSFRNQRDHDQLVRAAALDVLGQLKGSGR